MARIPVLEIVRRTPAVLLAALYLLVASRRGGQVGALFELLRFPGDHVALLGVAIASGLALTLLTARPTRVWRAVDFALFLAPVLALVFAFVRVPDFESNASRIAATAGLGIAALLAGIGAYRQVAGLPPPAWRRAAQVAGLSFLVWLGFYLATLASPVAFPRAAGTLLVGLTFFGLSAVVLQLALCRPALGAPAVMAFAAAFFLNEQAHRLAIVDRTNDPTATGTGDLSRRGDVTLRHAFAVWLRSRNDLWAYRRSGQDYPVFIVTAEGGGGYAAAHSYLFLSKMQRHCPNFVQHIFAIVGVSGGAVGEAEFWRSLGGDLNPELPKGCTGETHAAEDIALLSTDHLSPVVAALFFHDFPNKILFGLLPGRERSSALVASLTAEAPLGDPRNPLYWDHYWRAGETMESIRLGETPAILPVATNAVSGRRYVFAPFAFYSPRCRFEEALHDLSSANFYDSCAGATEDDSASDTGADDLPGGDAGQDEDPPLRVLDTGLFDAAVASASFPYVTPSVLLDGWQGSVNLVDGGYLDNSGAETAREIVLQIQNRDNYFDGFFHLVDTPTSFAGRTEAVDCEDDPAFVPWGFAPRLNDEISDLPPGRKPPCGTSVALKSITIRAEPTQERFSRGQSFLLDPFRALVNGRARRAETARTALLATLCGGVDCPTLVGEESLPAIGYLDSVIEPDSMTLPLGWYMPPSRIRELDRVVVPDTKTEFFDAGYGTFQTMKQNFESVDEIVHRLDPDADERCDAPGQGFWLPVALCNRRAPPN